MQFFFGGGGILKLSDLDSVTIFILGGILKLLDLDSVTIFFLGGILKLLDLDSVTIFFLGGILKLLDLDSVTIFFLGGILKLLDLDSVTIFFLGGILKLSDLDSVTIFIGGGYSETLGFGLSDNFHFLGGILKLSDLDSLTIFILGGGDILKMYFRKGDILPDFGQKFQPLEQAHASQKVSHILRMWRLINSKEVKGSFFYKEQLIGDSYRDTSLEFSRNTQSWQCCHICTAS